MTMLCTTNISVYFTRSGDCIIKLHCKLSTNISTGIKLNTMFLLKILNETTCNTLPWWECIRIKKLN